MKQTWINIGIFSIIYCLIYSIFILLNWISFNWISLFVPLIGNICVILLRPIYEPSTIIKKNKTLYYVSNLFLVLGIFSIILYFVKILDSQQAVKGILIAFGVSAFFRRKYNFPEKSTIIFSILLITLIAIGLLMFI